MLREIWMKFVHLQKQNKPKGILGAAYWAKATLLFFTPMCLGILKKHEWRWSSLNLIPLNFFIKGHLEEKLKSKKSSSFDCQRYKLEKASGNCRGTCSTPSIMWYPVWKLVQKLMAYILRNLFKYCYLLYFWFDKIKNSIN